MTSAVDPRVPHTSTDVLIAGAGPVGLALAVQLRRSGIDTLVVDRRAERAPFAKAVGVSPRTLEVFDSMGIVRDALDASITMRGQIARVGDAPPQTFEMTLPDSIPYRAIALPQYETERILADALTAHGGRVLREVELTGFDQHDDTVTSTLHGPRGRSTVSSRYLVGCDGAHSVVRKTIGSHFEGDAFPEEYMLADVEVDWDQPAGFAVRTTHLADGTIDDLMVAIPLPGPTRPGHQRYRISMLVPPELRTDATAGEVAHGLEGGRAPELHHVQAVLDRLAPEPTTASNLRWSSVFRISHRLASRYSRDRVFLAGDAAHIHPPTGAQGMNTGIQDACNLAWKLALAVRGRAADGLLETYHLERHPVGEEVVGRTVRNAREGIGAGESDPAVVMLREAQMLVAYPDSPLTAGTGQRAPDARGLVQDCSTVPLRVHDLLRHTGHTLLLWASTADEVDTQTALAARVADRYGDLVRCYVVTAGDDVDASGVVFRDASDEFAAAYSPGTRSGHLVRPDGYLGCTQESITFDDLAEHLSRTFA
ncbi:FAD-dependent monooxygenase [Rhodococcus sp. NPDC003318]|uniref:FAD-dependent monooxygenase n=1 Tax=Rhodococcus sp. NPDC003318 TaxID=3364503 RepID=UPI00368D7344